MTVYEFIAELNKTSDDAKEAFIKKHIVTDYIPYEKKIAVCEKIIENTSYENRNIDGEKVKAFKLNSCARYMYYVLWMIKLYTDIEIEFADGKGLEVFNLLNKGGLIDIVIGMISEKETSEFKQILDMVFDDMLVNERDIVSYIDDKILGLRSLVNLFMGQLENVISNIKAEDITQALNKRAK